MTRSQRRNPLAIPTGADIPLASEEPAALKAELLYDYSQIDERHRDQVMLSARRIKVRAERTKHDLLAIGKELAAVKERLDHGQFTGWIEQEFGMSIRTAQRFMNVYAIYGDKNDTVSFLHDSALYLLSGPSVPEAARQEVEAEAKTTGQSPTKARVKQIIDQHKAPRPLTLEETVAVVWRAIQHHVPPQGAQTAGVRLAWLQNARPADFEALLRGGVTLDEQLLKQAHQQVEAELRSQQPPERPPAQAERAAPLPAASSAQGGRRQTLSDLCTALLRQLAEYSDLTGDRATADQVRVGLETMLAKLRSL